ncbi:hypothetical protein [Kitasatospora sp. GAS204B]|uniref:hypothetical protein n=1 Tax=unclassified Kitasatospora TaxID=2633591 RepID=UPI002475E994|nr:hypothetical protein [Kitasatospora sp. GAS204B]MDH6117297.1 hypothetical protein [Kitasatospora sp. GAS204B]
MSDRSVSSPRFIDRMFAKPVRWAALLVLVAGYLAVLVSLFPVHSENSMLVDDLRSHRTSVVRLDTDGSQVFAEWSTGVLDHKAETYRFAYGNPGSAGAIDAFEQVINQATVGSGATVRFQTFDASHGFGGLSVFVSVLYPSVLGWSLLSVGAYATGLLIISHILLGAGRRRDAGAGWLWICLLTGFGFFSYLWLEPSPLLAFAMRRPKPARTRPLGVLGALGATTVAAAFLAALGLVFIHLIDSVHA